MKATLQFVEKYYTDDLAERESPESKWAAEWAKYVKGKSVLDAGCGPQFYNDALAFSEIPKEFVGIDANETNIEFLKTSTHPKIIEAKEALKNYGTKIELLLDDIRIEKPEFLGKFDSVYASGLIGNFDDGDTRQVLQNFYSYLKPGGILVIVSWLDDYLSEEKSSERKSYNWYDPQELRPEDYGRLLKRTGFSIEKEEVYKVRNPKAYEWGTIFAFVAKK